MASKSKINWYERYAKEHLVTGSDDKGMYCMVVSERIENLSYRVDVDESTMTATRCQCASLKSCKHMRYVNEVLAPLAPKPTRINEIEASTWYTVNSDSQVWWDEEMQQWFAVGLTENALDLVLAHIEKQQAVREVAKPVVAPVVVEPAVQPVVSPEKPAQEVVSPVAEQTDEFDAERHFWNPNLQCYCYRRIPNEPVAFLSDRPAPVVEAPKVVDITKRMLDAPLTQNRAFSLLKVS